MGTVQAPCVNLRALIPIANKQEGGPLQSHIVYDSSYIIGVTKYLIGNLKTKAS